MSGANNLDARAFQVSTSDDNGTESFMSSFSGSNIRISNEPELRLNLRKLDEESKGRRFLAYADEDKGLLESSSQAGSYCNSLYLKAIRHNLAIVKMACQLEIDTEYEVIEAVIVATKGELSRLRRHPELFPSKDIKEEFWQNVHFECNHSVNSVILKQEARDHAHRMYQAARVEVEEDMRSPGRDTQRKPWEQFFHNRAPGTGADLSLFAEEGSLQIIPMAAARLLMSTIEEHRAIIHDIEAQREDLRPYAPSFNSHLKSTALRQSPYGHLRSYKAFTDLLPVTTAGPIDIVRHGDIDSLETLNLDLAALNGRRSIHGRRTWNCVNVVLHDRPNYGVDSKQSDERVDEMMSLLN